MEIVRWIERFRDELEKPGWDISAETAASVDVHFEIAAKLWKFLTNKDRIIILRHGTLLSNIRRDKGEGDLGDDSWKKAEAEAIKNLSNMIESQNLWGEKGCKDSMLANLIYADKTEVALKLIMLFAALYGKQRLVKELFKPPHASSNESGKRREHVTGSILKLAARMGYLCVFKDYFSDDELHRGLEPNKDTLLHIAAEHGHMDDVRELLRAGAKCELNGKSWTPLHSAAAAKKPNAAIAKKLVKRISASYINQQSESGNTALHIAAYNVNMTADFLYELRDSDPFVVNDEGLTPLDVAATAADCPHIIVAMLDVFLPIMSRAELEDNSQEDMSNMRNDDDVDGIAVVKETGPVKAVRFKPLLRKSLLKTCIRNGLVDAVVLLIEHGTDRHDRHDQHDHGIDMTDMTDMTNMTNMTDMTYMTDVLHMIVAESVHHPEKIDKLKAIYRSVVDQVMRPRRWWLKIAGSKFTKEDGFKDNPVTRIVQLIETPSQLCRGMNVIELAIHTGAQEMLLEIVHTLNVYRFENYDRTSYKSDDVIFDVTNMTHKTYRGTQTSSPKTCYLEAILSHEEIWRESDLLDKEPFKELTMRHVTFVQRFYLLVGLIQMIFMVILSVYHLPSACSLNDQFGLNISWCQTQEYGTCAQSDSTLVEMILVHCIGNFSSANVIRVYPNGAWLIWPIILCLFVTCSVTNDLLMWLRPMQFIRQRCRRNCSEDSLVPKPKVERKPPLVRLLSIVLKQMPRVAFSVAVFVWFDYYKNTQQFTYFLEALSMVFLFGWLLTFDYLSRIHKQTYMFTMILKEIIIEDILSNFMPIFVFTVVGFGFAVHVLTQTMLPADTVLSLNVSIYNTFLAAVSVGNLVSLTFDPNYYIVNGRLGFFRVVVAVYVSFAAIILLQVLVSMFTTRYQSATVKAERMWRFDCISVVMPLLKLQLVLFRRTTKSGHRGGLMRLVDSFLYCLYKRNPKRVADNCGDKYGRHFISVKRSECDESHQSRHHQSNKSRHRRSHQCVCRSHKSRHRR